MFGLIVWVRQPVRTSHQLLLGSGQNVARADEIAELTDDGRLAYDTLTALRASPDWPELAGQSYSPPGGKRDGPNT